MRVRPGGPAYRHLPVRGRIIGKRGVVKFFGYPANPYGARRRAGCLPDNPKQVAILPAIQVQSGYTGMIVGDVQRLNAQLQGSLRSNTDTECRLAIGFVPIERLGERRVVLVGKSLRARLEAYKGPRMRDAIRIAAEELPGGVAIRTLRKGARSRVVAQRQPGAAIFACFIVGCHEVQSAAFTQPQVRARLQRMIRIVIMMRLVVPAIVALVPEFQAAASRFEPQQQAGRERPDLRRLHLRRALKNVAVVEGLDAER